MKITSIAIAILFILNFISTLSFSQTWSWTKNPDCGINAALEKKEITVDAITKDGESNLYITGSVKGATPIDFGNNITLAGDPNLFGIGWAYTAKFDKDGNAKWAKLLGNSSIGSASKGKAIVCNENNLFITGSYFGYVYFGNGINTLISASGGNAQNSSDIFVVKCDMSGNVVWAQSANLASGSFRCEGLSLALDRKANECVFTGNFSGSCAFFTNSSNPVVLTSSAPNKSNMFIAKFENTQGHLIWAKSTQSNFGNTFGQSVTSVDEGYCVAGTSYNNQNDNLSFGNTISIPYSPVNVTGICGNTININQSDAFIAKYTLNGNIQWAQKLGGEYTDVASGISSDGLNNIYVTGRFGGVAMFGNHKITSTDGTILTNTIGNNSDFFIAKFNGEGISQWAKNAGGVDYFDAGLSIATTPKGLSYVTGYYFGVADFGGGSKLISPTFGNDCIYPLKTCTSCDGLQSCVLPAKGCHNIFVAKYDTQGNLIFSKSGGEGTSSGGVGICFSEKENQCYIAGNFNAGKSFFDEIVVQSQVFTGCIASLTEAISTAKIGLQQDSESNMAWSKSDLSVFPNPSSSTIIIKALNGKNFERVTISITNCMGHVVRKIEEISQQEITIDKGNLSSGIYFLQLFLNRKRIETVKLVFL